MKIRNGFVSNSSSSSFCIYGVQVDTDELNEYFFTSEKVMSELKKESKKETDEEVKKYFSSWSGRVDTSGILESLGFEVFRGEWDDVLYIGEEWSAIGNDQTPRDWKESIEKEITEKLPGLELSFGTYEESYYNG